MSDYVCTLTAEAWQLYTSSVECSNAATAINRVLTDEVRAAHARLKAEPCLSELKVAAQVRDAVYEVMADYADHGACDTEPECVLVEEIERALGLDAGSLDR